MRIFHSYQNNQKVYASQKQEVVIGRADQGKVPDLDLSDPKNPDDCDFRVSRQHMRIGVDASDGYWIEDLGSKHGTWIGEKDIKGQGRRPLALGEAVVIGDTIIQELEEAPASAFPGLPIHLEVECQKTVNCSLIHAGIPFVKKLRVIHLGDSPLTEASRAVSQALLNARNICAGGFGENDMTWARYVLFGEPFTHIPAMK